MSHTLIINILSFLIIMTLASSAKIVLIFTMEPVFHSALKEDHLTTVSVRHALLNSSGMALIAL